MSKLGKEQVMVAEGMTRRGTSIRQVAGQLRVTEGAVRYRLKKRAAAEVVDGRSNQPTAVDGFEDVVHGLLERVECARLTGEGRPVQARLIYELLVRDFGYEGSYQAVVRHLRRRYGAPKLRALRRVETPPGVQAQHDWFEVRSRLEGRAVRLQMLTGVLSHSRARFCRVSRRAGQLDWQAGHLGLFERYGGVPLWVRIDNLKTGVARGAGPTAVLNGTYQAFARQCGFEVDPCRPAQGSDKGKVERGVRIFRQHFADLLGRGWDSLETLQGALDMRAELQDFGDPKGDSGDGLSSLPGCLALSCTIFGTLPVVYVCSVISSFRHTAPTVAPRQLYLSFGQLADDLLWTVVVAWLPVPSADTLMGNRY